MDNIAHTLVGAALGRSVADRRIPAPMILGMVAANAPDWTELVLGVRGRGPSFYLYHRGITHSFVGAAVEIAAFTGLTALWLARRRRRMASAGPLPWGTLVALFASTVLSHLWMDWQGSYGLRPFLPWSGRWYYGDWVAIVDPVFWFVPIVALAWGGRRHWRPAAAWLALLVPIVALVALSATPSAALRWACLALVVVGVAGWHRHWFGPAARRTAAALAVALLVAYAGAQGVGAQLARAAARRAAVARFGPGARSAALTVVGHPFEWEVVIADSDSVAAGGWAAARHLDRPEVRRAVATPEGHALAQFARFLFAEIDSTGRSPVVVLGDARFGRPGRVRFASVRVPLP